MPRPTPMPMAARANPGGGRTMRPPTGRAMGGWRSSSKGSTGGDRAPCLSYHGCEGRSWRWKLPSPSPSCWRMNLWRVVGAGCAGMAVEVLSVGLFAPPVGCGKWDNCVFRMWSKYHTIRTLLYSTPDTTWMVWPTLYFTQHVDQDVDVAIVAIPRRLKMGPVLDTEGELRQTETCTRSR